MFYRVGWEMKLVSMCNGGLGFIESMNIYLFKFFIDVYNIKLEVLLL